MCVLFQFSEEKFELRKLSQHLIQCDTLNQEPHNWEQNSKEFGINRRSILLELHHFDPCSGALVPDIMHDLFEGVLQYEAKLVLQRCINQQKYFSLSMLAQKLECVELGYMEVGNRPSPITSQVLNSKERSLTQKGK